MGPTLSSFDDPLALIVSALAVYRLTRLITADVVTERLRRPFERRGERWAYFITCPWCTSVWIAAGWALLLWLAPTVALVLGAWLTFSAVAGLLSSWE